MSQPSTANCTPGPWSVDEQSSLPRILSPDRVVAVVVSHQAPDSTRETALADARVMAAALEMYSLLDSIAEAADSLLQLTGESTRAWKLAGTIAQQARALRSRAEGRAQA